MRPLRPARMNNNKDGGRKRDGGKPAEQAGGRDAKGLAGRRVSDFGDDEYRATLAEDGIP